MYADTETGLYYNMARYYDPRIGGYISSDPIGLAGGLNTYRYVGNNPLRWIDPWGLVELAPEWGGGLGGGPGESFEEMGGIRIGTGGGGSFALGESSVAGRSALSEGKMCPVRSEGARPVPQAPDFVVSPNGTAFPVPKGSIGPSPVINPAGKITGSAFTGGNGGVNGQVDTMRMMNPTPPIGSSPGYPSGYIKYENSFGQGVDPYTGRTVPNSQSHFPIE